MTNEQTQPMDWDLALSTIDMPADDRASIEAEKNAAHTPASAQTGENPAPAASAEPVAEKQTDSSATATTVTAENANASEGEQQNDDYFELDPTKTFKLPDGTILKGSQVLQGMSKKAELDREKWQFNEEKKQLQSKLDWLATAEQTNSTRDLLQLVEGGLSEAEAIAVLAKKYGAQAPAQTQPSPSESLTIDPAELAARLPKMPEGMEVGTDEANLWYMNVYEPAKTATTIAIVLERQQKIAEANAAKAQAEAEAKAKQGTEASKVAAYNDSMLTKMGEYMTTRLGIHYPSLTAEQQADVNQRLEHALVENNLGWVVDEQGKTKNILRETDIKAVVADAFPENANPYKTGAPSRPIVSQEKPLSAEPPVAQVRALGTNGFNPDNYASPMDAALAQLAADK